MTNRAKQLIGIVFSIALFTLSEWTLFSLTGNSFVQRLAVGSPMPFAVFIAGCAIGMAWEYIGQFALPWWRYPPIDRHRYLLAVLPLFWGIFMLIMQDGYAIARVFGLSVIPAAVISTIVIGLLIEGINLYTRSWEYRGWAASYIVLTVGWVIFLATTFVLGFNVLFGSPFGY